MFFVLIRNTDPNKNNKEENVPNKNNIIKLHGEIYFFSI